MNISCLIAFLGLLAFGVNGIGTERQVLITYPSNAPQSDLKEYKDAIEAAGGAVLHEFELFKGFIVKASSQAIDTIHTLSQEYPPTIEDDHPVTIAEQR